MDTINLEELSKEYITFDPSQVMILFNDSPKIVSKWGARSFIVYEELSLRFFVNGKGHKGRVWIFSLKESFDVYFTTEKDEVKEIIKDIKIDKLIKKINDKIIK
jgi:hypothetical protein